MVRRFKTFRYAYIKSENYGCQARMNPLSPRAGFNVSSRTVRGTASRHLRTGRRGRSRSGPIVPKLPASDSLRVCHNPSAVRAAALAAGDPGVNLGSEGGGLRGRLGRKAGRAVARVETEVGCRGARAHREGHRSRRPRCSWSRAPARPKGRFSTCSMRTQPGEVWLADFGSGREPAPSACAVHTPHHSEQAQPIRGAAAAVPVPRPRLR